MKVLSGCLTLCTLLALSRAYPVNTSSPHRVVQCEYEREHCQHLIGEYCPQCDDSGNYIRQQCSWSTGYCWCVDVISGQEIPHTRTSPGSHPVDCDSDFYCPHGWSSFRKRCFIFNETPKTWLEAEIYCQFDGGNLASIHSYEENHFVMSLTRGYTQTFPETWIGASDAIHPGYWMWTDGSKFYYKNWYNDDGDDGDETDDNCLKMNYKHELKWFYASCNSTLPFVCSKN
ncbi:galactose-specific lectin nattectin isoform X2 [Mastacembelus armatus]|nr:galactose-specific lectin nattectin-like isoform X2 [Mastacembelus armatus]